MQHISKIVSKFLVFLLTARRAGWRRSLARLRRIPFLALAQSTFRRAPLSTAHGAATTHRKR
jgi:hypothetical protein